MEWDEFYLSVARTVALKSRDPHTKVGALIASPNPDHSIVSVGYNDFPRGVIHFDSRYERPAKYDWIVHAEMNAILNAARCGSKVLGCILYCTHPPCCECAKAIIQAGIVVVAFPSSEKGTPGSPWTQKLSIMRSMFEEAKVYVRYL